MDHEDLLLAIVAEAQEDREAIHGLKEAVQALIGQNDKQLEKLPRAVREVLSAVPSEVRKGVKDGSEEVLREMMRPAAGEVKELTSYLKAAATEAQASAKALRHTGLTVGLYALAFGLAVGLIGWGLMGYKIKNRHQELDHLDAVIATRQTTLEKLGTKTWGLELLEGNEEGRIIVLPKGVKYVRNGAMQDGSGRVGIVVTP